MSSDNKKEERKKFALTEQTYENLKNFSRLNGLKMRIVIDSMADVILQDEELSKRIIDLTIEKQSKN
ncbi:MAG TPA: hypothetical protein VIE65_15990 [Methylobacter sp.]